MSHIAGHLQSSRTLNLRCTFWRTTKVMVRPPVERGTRHVFAARVGPPENNMLAVAYVLPTSLGILELTHNHGTENDLHFQGYSSGNSEPGRGFGHIKDLAAIVV